MLQKYFTTIIVEVTATDRKRKHKQAKRPKMYQSSNFKKHNISTTTKSLPSSELIFSNITKNLTSSNTSRGTKESGMKIEKKMNSLLCLAFLLTINAFSLDQTEALSLISEKCDPNKVGPDETTVKGGWQAEMFNGLSFRACGK